MNKEQMAERLKKTYPDAEIEVFDLTGTGDHWEVSVSTQAFQGLNRIQQHQAIMAVFGPELKTGEVHALAIKTQVRGAK